MVSTARSFLFVPADQQRRLQRAWTTPTDAVIADLEDAVLPERKARARQTLEVCAAASRPEGLLIVRINGLDTEYAAADLDMVGHCPGVDAVVVPKATAAALATRPCELPIIALVETARGILEAEAIASLPGVARLLLGTIDFAADVGVQIDPRSPAFVHARATLALASAAAALPGPIDGVWASLNDHEGLRDEARVAKSAGFAGKACIHPSQLGVVHDVFSPTPGELSRARRIVAAAEIALSESQGAISVDGCMVDLPVLNQARRLLADAS